MTNETKISAETPSHSAAGQYLTILLAPERYGIPILRVQEILGRVEPMPFPHGPAYLRGVFNLRGTVFPLIDLRRRFGLPTIPPEESQCTVVVRAQLGSGLVLVGLQVDTVLDVQTFSAKDFQSIPNLGNGIQSSLVAGVVNTSSQAVILLNIDEMLAGCADVLVAACAPQT